MIKGTDSIKFSKRKVIVVGLEGNKRNKTEKVYLQELLRKQKEYSIVYADGNQTDALSIVNSIIKKCRDLKISKKDRLAFCVIDTDNDMSKKEIITRASQKAKMNNIQMVVSTPCIEYWILLHYKCTSKHFFNVDELITEIRKYNPKYTKNLSNFDFNVQLINNAIKNNEICQKNLDGCSDIIFHNPYTDFDNLVKLLLKG